MNPRKEKFIKTAKANPLRLKTHGFIHIPKTGGTSIFKFGGRLNKAGHKFPVTFPHGWTVDQILKEFPKMKLSFVIRDPLERSISGINSRIRMGRPQYNVIWDIGEAVTFSFFSSAVEIIEGLSSKDQRIRSAAIFAFSHISHLKHGYEFYFKSPEAVRENAHRFVLVSELAETDGFVASLCGQIGISPELRDQHYRRMHVAPKSTRSVVDELSPAVIAAAREHLAAEYAIYHELRTLIGAR